MVSRALRVLAGLTAVLAISPTVSAADLLQACSCVQPSVQVKHEGQPSGQMRELNGSKLLVWETIIRLAKAHGHGIIYLPDAFGLDLVQNRLLADTMAAAGYLVVLPDYFARDPAPSTTPIPAGFNLTAWAGRQTPAKVDAIIDTTLKFMRTELSVKKIGAVGYCFGGRYVARRLGKAAGEGGVDVGFTAHPSLTTDDEWKAVSRPISLAVAETDTIMDTPKRRQVEALLKGTGVAYQINLYGSTQHGFGVRVNLADQRQKFAKESAFWQAIRWFDEWVKSCKC